MFLFSKFGYLLSKFISTVLATMLTMTPTFTGGLLLRGYVQNPLSVYSHSFYSSTEKIDRTGLIDNNRTYKMYLAKNETEGCQFVVRARDSRRNSFIEFGEFTNSEGDVLKSEIYRESYVATTDNGINGKNPDPIVPVERKIELGFSSNANYVYFIKVISTEETEAGDYSATITFGNGDTESIYERSTAELSAHVWNFTLPDNFTMDTAMGLEKYDLKQRCGDSSEERYKQYYDFLLEHGISAYSLPYDILDSRADAYMSDPRVKSFLIPYGSDDQIKAYYSKLSTNEEWLKKSYFYPIDEPSNAQQIESYNQICERLARLFPGYNMVTPFYTNEVEDMDLQNVNIQDGKSNIICPETVLYSEKSFCDTVKDRVERGDKAWWYVCCGPAPTTDYCNLFVQQDGLKHRILFWQQKLYNVTGLLYWSTNYWRDTQSKEGLLVTPWESAWSTPWTGNDTYGDGVLLYYGNKIGIDGPISSLRLEAVLNGIEDYEYLVMLEDAMGEDETRKIINKVTSDLTHYTYSSDRFDNTRIELGNNLEKYYSEK